METTKTYMREVKIDGNCLNEVPEEFRTEEICRIALQNRGEALAFVPKELKTKEMCMIAFENSAWAIRYFPKEFLTEEIFREAVKKGNTRNIIREDVDPEDEEEIDDEEYDDDYDGDVIQFIPEKYLTEEMCLTAVQRKGKALEFVPKKFKTKRVCIAAVKNDIELLDENSEVVPDKMLTEEMFKEYFPTYEEAIRFLADIGRFRIFS